MLYTVAMLLKGIVLGESFWDNIPVPFCLKDTPIQLKMVVGNRCIKQV